MALMLALPAVIGTPASAAPDAASQHVDGQAGSDSPGCGSESAPCRTIQYAVNLAEDGDTIRVAGSQGGTVYTYEPATDVCSEPLGTTGVVCIFNRHLTIRGGYASDEWHESDPVRNPTIIDGGGSERGVLVLGIDGSASAEIDGFLIRNGLARAVSRRPGDDRIFSFGGGLLAEGARQVTVRSTVFVDNRSLGSDVDGSYGGTGSGGGASFRAVDELLLENLEFRGNEARGGRGRDRGGYGIGGGVHIYRTHVTGRHLLFAGNRAVAGDTSGDGRAEDGQRGDALGAAIAIMESEDSDLAHLTAVDNVAVGGNGSTHAGGAFGGAVYYEFASGALTDSLLSGNSARGGRAEHGWLGNGGGLQATDAELTLERLTVVDNLALGGTGSGGDQGSGGGGGISVTSINPNRHGAAVILRSSVIAGNRALMGQGTVFTGGGGGGLWLQALPSAAIEHVTLADNEVTPRMHGIAVLLIDAGGRGAHVTLANSIIAGHGGTGGASAALHVKPLSSLVLRRGLWSGNERDTNADGAVGAAGTFSGLETMFEGEAAFAGPAAPSFDYHLTGASAAIDAAEETSLAVDIDGDPRPQGAEDLGADEYVPTAPRLALTHLNVFGSSAILAWNISGSETIARTAVHLTESERWVEVGSATSVVLDGLEPDRLYWVEVLAYNSAGDLVAASGQHPLLPGTHRTFLPHTNAAALSW